MPGSLKRISELSGKEYEADEATTKAFRIIADHMRTSTFILGDDRGVSPSIPIRDTSCAA